MNLSFSQLLFIFLFDILFLLLFLFGDSFLGLYVIAGLTALFLSFWRQLDFSRLLNYKKIFFIWALFLFSLIFSSFFTHNLPLTINALVFYAFTFLVFWFFLLLKPKFMSRDLILGNFLIISLVLIVLSVGFSLIPEWGSLIPGMNLLYSSYGHNHLSVLLLLMIPVSWYFYVKFKGKFLIKFKNLQIYLFLLFPLVLTSALLITFARVAIFTGFIQFLAIAYLFYKKRINFKKNKPLKLTLVALSLVFFAVLFFKTFFSVATLIKPDFTCSLPPQYKTKICKNLSEEVRLFYWGQALSAIKDYPLIGFGPGTFSLISKKYKQIPYAETGYAHNAFLQTLAEGGVISGVFFIVLMGYLLMLSFKQIFNLKQLGSAKAQIFLFKLKTVLGTDRLKLKNHKIFLLLGIVSIYFDVLFDFDWSFLGIFSLTLIFIALIIKNQSAKNISKSYLQKNSIHILIFKTLSLMISFTILLLAGVYTSTEILIAQNKTKQAFQFFPYFQYHMILFVQSDQLLPQDKEKLLQIYQNQPLFYSFYKANLTANEKKIALDRQLFLLDPWQRYFFYNLKHFSVSGYEEATRELKEISALITNASQKYHWEADFEITKRLSKLAVLAGDQYYLDGNYKKAGQTYVLARDLNFWALSDNKPIFLEQKLENLADLEILLGEMKGIKKQSWGWNEEAVAKEHHRLLSEAIKNKNLSQIKEQLIRIFEITPWKAWEIEKNEARQMQAMADQFLEQAAFVDAEKTLKLMSQYGAYWSKVQLGNFYMLEGRDELARQTYDQCIVAWKTFTPAWGENKIEEQHDDCFFASEALKNGWKNRDRYYQVSQIIRGEAVWEDFVNP